MLSRTIAAFCIIDDALQAMGHKDDPQTKVPSSVILTLAILAAMELGGKHNKALALAKGSCQDVCVSVCVRGAYRS
jgi:hypothetical protein